MPAKGSKKGRGARFTPPKINTPDARDAEAHHPGAIAAVRRVCGEIGAAGGVRTVREAKGASGRVGDQCCAAVPPKLASVDIVCDREDLSCFGGMVPFGQFAYGCGLAQVLGGVPIHKRESPYSVAKLLEVVSLGIVAGWSRVSHVNHYTYDPGLCAILGLDRLPDQATLSRAFAAVSDEAISYLRNANGDISSAMVSSMHRAARQVVDIDTRVIGLFGNQEGAVRSRRNNGKPHMTLELAILRGTFDALAIDLLRGATHPAPLFPGRLDALLKQLAQGTDEVVICADSAWHSAEVLRSIEAAHTSSSVPCRCGYAIRVQMKPRHQEAIAAIPEEDWAPCGEGLEIAEYRLAFIGSRAGDDPTVRRHIVTRKAKRRDSAQLVLLDAAEFEHHAIVTNLHWRAKAVWVLYNHRATIETVLCEGALGFHMDSLPSASFTGNQMYIQLLMLAYNLVNLFRRLCLPKQHSRHHVTTLRHLLLALPALLEHTADGILLHFASHGPHVKLLPFIIDRIRRWLLTPGSGPPTPQPT